ncbi:helix-turn-helix transcriptional regulator [Flavobacterium sp.]|uniref:helix-turn-helix domain-containing protein n=1 Tax=Flavobacterium sp. TaxID=239 RepID=UPI002635DFFB|nr:helix-turn-helix transcriptional regulator [Flavobacterium sp.]MDG2432561.1 helix-turn-helix transcriptional regulator [Flavobacterium sp.]
MVNTEDFIKRLEIILDYYSLNASGFADKIGVQRSSLSHLLSGRNKPSLDFILKILEVFPDVDLYWILNGKGNFPKNEEATPEKLAPATPTVAADKNEIGNLFSENAKEKSNTPAAEIEIAAIANSFPATNNEKNEIEKIVIFYKNGTFKSYVP